MVTAITLCWALPEHGGSRQPLGRIEGAGLALGLHRAIRRAGDDLGRVLGTSLDKGVELALAASLPGNADHHVRAQGVRSDIATSSHDVRKSKEQQLDDVGSNAGAASCWR